MTLRVAVLLSTAMVCAAPAVAQQGSPVADLLVSAQNALNDIDYARADSVARSLLELGEQLSEAQRIRVYQILAAASFPEEEDVQRPYEAAAYFRSALQLDPAARMARDITWPGLDSLFEATRRSTFAVKVVATSDTVLAGQGAAILFRVRATRPANYALVADNERGSMIELDRKGPMAQGELAVTAFDGEAATLSSGSHTFWIRAVDPISGEEVEFAYDVTIVAPAFSLVTVPSTIDSSLFLPEQTTIHRRRNALIGLGLGGTTALAATAFGGSNELSGVSSNNRAYFVAGVMTVGALVGAYFEKPQPMPENIAYNEQVRADFASNVRLAMQRNEDVRARYRVTVIVIGEIR